MKTIVGIDSDPLRPIHGNQQGRADFLPALTGLRGVGAVWVVAFHLTQGRGYYLIDSGYLGVDLFFILSGFILSHVHAKDFCPYSVRRHTRFLMLRLARIYPLHVFVLLCLAAVVVLLPGFATRYRHPEWLDFAHFLASLFLVHNWGVGPPTLWNAPSWSLSVEWLAYLLFPFVALGCARWTTARTAPIVGVSALAVLVCVSRAVGYPGLDGMGKFGVLRMACEFLIGCLLFRFFSCVQSAKIPWSPLAWTVLLLIMVGVSYKESRWLSVFGFALLVVAVANEPGFVARTLSHRVALFLGEISFSLYLCHWPLIQIHNWYVSRNYTDSRLAVTVLVLAVAVVSLLTWRYVEMPGRKIGRRLARSADGVMASTCLEERAGDRRWSEDVPPVSPSN